MSAPDLSVVMPAYDTAAYVGEAIASVVDGADRLLELIVVDDGSTDETAAIARSFGGPVRVIALEENGGVAAARNVGMAAARGAYLGFLDSDDLWVADRPDPRLAALDADPSLSGAFGYCRFFVPGDDGAPRIVLEPMVAAEMGALILRRSVLDDVGGFDESFRLGEDMDFIGRVQGKGHRLERLDARVFLDRLRPGSLTRDRDAVLGGWLQVARAALQRQREEGGAS